MQRQSRKRGAARHRESWQGALYRRFVNARLGVRAQIALAWLLAKPAITAPIVGATKLNHLDDAVAAVAVRLTADEIAALEEPYVPHAVVGFA
jgi:aryl-alcohol dehydrogenase-like predicted oxidoreductase